MVDANDLDPAVLALWLVVGIERMTLLPPNLKLSKDGLKIRTTIWLRAQFGYCAPHTYGLTIGPVAVGYIATASLIESPRCSIPDDHIDPRRSAFFMARSILRGIRGGVRAC
jgi:hypothetical protein